ncbi:hypothetical protein Tco_0386458 [Tanacetum coccineum]|uniref:Uncharacterized protein n=1 Tax=Tanacetum coccineum TaxID=301880 RepID=A0ABQ4YI69_9ASTR
MSGGGGGTEGSESGRGMGERVEVQEGKRETLLGSEEEGLKKSGMLMGELGGGDYNGRGGAGRGGGANGLGLDGDEFGGLMWRSVESGECYGFGKFKGLGICRAGAGIGGIDVMGWGGIGRLVVERYDGNMRWKRKNWEGGRRKWGTGGIDCGLGDVRWNWGQGGGRVGWGCCSGDEDGWMIWIGLGMEGKGVWGGRISFCGIGVWRGEGSSGRGVGVFVGVSGLGSAVEIGGKGGILVRKGEGSGGGYFMCYVGSEEAWGKWFGGEELLDRGWNDYGEGGENLLWVRLKVHARRRLEEYWEDKGAHPIGGRTHGFAPWRGMQGGTPVDSHARNEGGVGLLAEDNGGLEKRWEVGNGWEMRNCGGVWGERWNVDVGGKCVEGGSVLGAGLVVLWGWKGGGWDKGLLGIKKMWGFWGKYRNVLGIDLRVYWIVGRAGGREVEGILELEGGSGTSYVVGYVGSG